MRTYVNFTLKSIPLKRMDLDNLVALYMPVARDERKPTWVEKRPEGRWRSHCIEELLAWDKASVDPTWLKDDSVENSANLPSPEVVAGEIAEDLRSALEQFEAIQADLTKV